MNQMQADVVIIGGGLAGLAAARELSQETRITVIILEPGKSIRNNPARLTFADTIQQFGLEAGIIKPYATFRLRTVNGIESSHFFEDHPLVAIDYLKSCDLLYSSFIQTPTIQLIKKRAEKITVTRDNVEVEITGRDKINCKLVIDASGTKHFYLHQFNLTRPALYSHSYGLFFADCGHNDDTICYFIAASKRYGSGGGWYYPYADHKASAGFAMVTSSSGYPARELQKKFNAAVQEFFPFCDYLKNAKVLKKEIGSIPIEHVDKMVYDRILLVGDAAGLATPWMCMGVEPALISGQLAGRAARSAVVHDTYSESYLQVYQQHWDKIYKNAYNKIKYDKQKIWFLPDEVWDFLIQYDVSRLSSKALLERIRLNKHLMSRFTVLSRWLWFKYIAKISKSN